MTATIDVSDGVCRFEIPGGRFLSTGFDGGVRTADAAYNVTVPEGWGDGGIRDLGSYVADRVTRAGFEYDGSAPALLTGVAQRHAAVARLGSVVVVATTGLSNPAALPVAAVEYPSPSETDIGRSGQSAVDDGSMRSAPDERPPVGTVNILVGTDRDLSPGALVNAVAVAAEAKAATLLATTGFPGTTSDAVVIACTTRGESTDYSGSATRVGTLIRACVRDAVSVSLSSRYRDEDPPATVDEAPYGVVTDVRATVSRLVP